MKNAPAIKFRPSLGQGCWINDKENIDHNTKRKIRNTWITPEKVNNQPKLVARICEIGHQSPAAQTRPPLSPWSANSKGRPGGFIPLIHGTNVSVDSPGKLLYIIKVWSSIISYFVI